MDRYIGWVAELAFDALCDLAGDVVRGINLHAWIDLNVQIHPDMTIGGARADVVRAAHTGHAAYCRGDHVWLSCRSITEDQRGVAHDRPGTPGNRHRNHQ